MYREEYSLRANVNIAQYRYFEISRFVVRPGHEKDWDDLAKMYIDGYGKASQNARWATYSSMYGSANGGVYIVFTPMKSLAEVDGELADGKKFEAQLGADGMKKLAELTCSVPGVVRDQPVLVQPEVELPLRSMGQNRSRLLEAEGSGNSEGAGSETSTVGGRTTIGCRFRLIRSGMRGAAVSSSYPSQERPSTKHRPERAIS